MYLTCLAYYVEMCLEGITDLVLLLKSNDGSIIALDSTHWWGTHASIGKLPVKEEEE